MLIVYYRSISLTSDSIMKENMFHDVSCCEEIGVAPSSEFLPIDR